MKISIITVTLNCESTVCKTINSVLEQSYEDIEYIIMDGESTDSTYRIVTDYAIKDKRIVFISQKDQGIYNAMNNALSYVTGEYVMFLNAGDFLFSNQVIYDLVETISIMKYPDIINGNTVTYVGDMEIVRIEKKGFNKFSMIMGNTICHQSLLAKSILFKEHIFDESYIYCADREWIYYMYSSGKKFKYINQNVVFYEGSGFSSGQSAKGKILEERFLIQKKYCKTFFYTHKLIRILAKLIRIVEE